MSSIRGRAVFDCMVFLQAAANRESPSGACFQLFEAGAIELLVSPAIISEVRDVLTRSKVRARFPALTDARVERLFEILEQNAVLIPDVPRAIVFDGDPKDEPYVNLAIAASARYLVSRDRDLLDLTKPEHSDPLKVYALAPQLEILDPVSFLNRIRLEPPSAVH